MRILRGFTAFLDMDGVLADFVAGACRYHETTKEEVLARNLRPDNLQTIIYGHDDLCKAIRADMTEQEFWLPIQEDEGFWTELPAFPWLKQLVNTVEGLRAPWFVLTSPGVYFSRTGEKRTDETSYIGKLAWLRKHLGTNFSNFIPIPADCKHLLANSKTLLIDDREKNVLDFREAGGHAIQFPSPFSVNGRIRACCEYPVDFVQSHLEDLMRRM